MLRIQCHQNPAIEALRTGLDQLQEVCEVIMSKFVEAVESGEHEIDLSKEI